MILVIGAYGEGLHVADYDAVSGQLTVVVKDGPPKRIGPGQSYTIPPGHDAWVEGNEPFVCIEVMSAEQFAKPQ